MAPTKRGVSQTDIISEFIRELEETTKQVHKLLEEINDSKVDLAEIKTELRILVDNVKELSGLVRDSEQGTGILTRVAIIEKNIEDLKEYMAKDSSAGADISTRVALIEASLEKTSSAMKVVFNKIDDRLNKLEDKKDDNLKQKKELTIVKKTEKWKLYSVIVTGVVSLAIAVATLMAKLFLG